MCIVTICCPACDVNFSLLIKPYQSHDKNVNISRTRRPFNMKLKAFSMTFKELSVVRIFLRPKSGHLSKHAHVFLMLQNIIKKQTFKLL